MTCSGDYVIRLWDSKTGQCVRKMGVSCVSRMRRGGGGDGRGGGTGRRVGNGELLVLFRAAEVFPPVGRL